MGTLYVETVGSGSPALVLLHGLGVNGAVWKPLVAELRSWPGRILIPDLRGHGRSPHLRPYGVGQHAADVAALLAPGEEVHILGHSMGGMIGLVLASGWFGVVPAHVLAFGVRTAFGAEELEKLRQFAGTPTRWFASRAEAAERFVRVAGLTGLADAESPVAAAGIVEEGGRWRLAADPATVLVAGPSFAGVMSLVQSPRLLACGSRDPMVAVADLRAFDGAAVEIPGSGHNPHVETPAALARLIPLP